MGLKIKTKNANAKYACNPNDVKKLFASFDIFVSFGYFGQTFKFNFRDNKHPHIKGQIIASASVHHLTESKCLDFYVIKDEAYNNKQQNYLIEMLLPQLAKWFEEAENKSETAILGALSSDIFLIEWFEGDFNIFKYYF